ncbi:MAG: hypothetical protein COA47_12735 [Robiginitomaculum sp.]|nr:MAG: hypothetical protein COA47_12735 [Robiginitomaculum sp.]
MLGIGLALTSAAFFGLNNATVRRGVLHATVLQGLAITVPFGVPIFAVIALIFGGFDAMANWNISAWGWMSLAGVVHFVFGRYGNYRATQALGATLSTPVQQISILVAIALAVVFLDESLTVLNCIGVVLVLIGPAIMMARRKKIMASAKSKGFEPQYLPGLFWGMICALGYGSSPLLIVLALGESGSVTDSIAGILVSYTAATLVVIALVMANGGLRYVTGQGRSSFNWFALSAVFVAASQLCRYMALALVPVSVVVPIQRLSVVFRIIFNAVLNRDFEVLDVWVIFSVILAVLGAVFLSLDSVMIANFLHLNAGWLSYTVF